MCCSESSTSLSLDVLAAGVVLSWAGCYEVATVDVLAPVC